MQMKKRTWILVLLLLPLLWGGCSQGEHRGLSTLPQLTEVFNSGELSNGVLRSDEPFMDGSTCMLSQDDLAIVKQQFDDFKTLAFETHAFDAQPLNYKSYAEVPVSVIAENPIVAHLQFLEIVDIETKEKLNFYDFPIAKREAFFNALLKVEQRLLEQKISRIPEILLDIKNLNTARDAVFRREGIVRLDVDELTVNGSTMHLPVRLRKIPSTSSGNLFDLIEEELVQQNSEESNAHPLLRGRSSSSEEEDYTYLSDRYVIAKHLEGKVRKGDILMYERNRNPLSPLFSWEGHNGIVNNPATWNTKKNTIFSIDAMKKRNPNGVQNTPFKVWCRPHFVLGLQRLVFEVRPRRPRSDRPGEPHVIPSDGIPIDDEDEVVCSSVHIEDLHRMAVRASWYIGVPYGGISNSLALTPKEFICSSLVWYCAKEEYGLDISNGAKHSVWPCDILESPYTYIKQEVK